MTFHLADICIAFRLLVFEQAWDEDGSISLHLDQLPPALSRQVAEALDGVVPQSVLRRTYRLPKAAGPLLHAVVTQLTHPGVSLAGHLAGVIGAAALMAGPAALALSAPLHAGLWLCGHAAVTIPGIGGGGRPAPRWGPASARLVRIAARTMRRVQAEVVATALRGMEHAARWLRAGRSAGGAGWAPAVGDRVRLTGLQTRDDLNGQVRGARIAALQVLRGG